MDLTILQGIKMSRICLVERDCKQAGWHLPLGPYFSWFLLIWSGVKPRSASRSKYLTTSSTVLQWESSMACVGAVWLSRKDYRLLVFMNWHQAMDEFKFDLRDQKNKKQKTKYIRLELDRNTKGEKQNSNKFTIKNRCFKFKQRQFFWLIELK